LKRNGGFDTVLTERPAELPSDSVVLTGDITKVDKGSPALRLMVGMGAGQAQVRGDFRILGPTGTELAAFTAKESYLGGAGIGGGGLVDTEDLVKRFAETVARAAQRWARGQPVS
jgi:hypothetical protein